MDWLTKHGYSPLTNWDDPPSARQIDSVFFFFPAYMTPHLWHPNKFIPVFTNGKNLVSPSATPIRDPRRFGKFWQFAGCPIDPFSMGTMGHHLRGERLFSSVNRRYDGGLLEKLRILIRSKSNTVPMLKHWSKTMYTYNRHLVWLPPTR